MGSPAQGLLNAYCRYVGGFLFCMFLVITLLEVFSLLIVRSGRDSDVFGGLCASALGYALMTPPPSRTRRLERIAYAAALGGGLTVLLLAFVYLRPEVPPGGLVTFAALLVVPAVTRVVQLGSRNLV